MAWRIGEHFSASEHRSHAGGWLMLGQWVLNPFAFGGVSLPVLWWSQGSWAPGSCGAWAEKLLILQARFPAPPATLRPRPSPSFLQKRHESTRNNFKWQISNFKFTNSKFKIQNSTLNFKIQNSNFKLQNSKSKVQIKTNSVQFSPIQPNAVQFNSIQFVCCYLSFVFGLINGDRPDGSSGWL